MGTAHFSPYSFRECLTDLLRQSRYALFEGPLDPLSMEKVVAAGMSGDAADTILNDLDDKTLAGIESVLGLGGRKPSFLMALQGALPTGKASLTDTLGSMRPWLTFFSIYTAFLKKNGWKHSVDMEAYEIAKELGKTVVFMETIEDQIEVLETLSREQMVDYLRRIDSWPAYTRDFMQWYVSADLARIERNPYGFPTRTPRVIDRRDAIFCETMQPYLEQGGAAVFVGAPHVSGVTRILVDAGFAVDRY